MQETKIAYPIRKYDARHDVMHVYLKSQQDAFADEEQKDIYVFRNDTSDEIVGFTIMDFSKNIGRVKALYPQLDLPQSLYQLTQTAS